MLGGRIIVEGRTPLVAGCVLAVLLAGCGGSSPAPAPPAARTVATTTAARPAPPDVPTKEAPNPWREPRPSSIQPHRGARVAHVIVHDVKRGTGLTVRRGDLILADYIEANYTRGREFFLAWGGEPWPTEIMFLRPENMMQGLIIGLRGMRVGGRRRVIIPRRLSDIHDSDRAGNSYYEIVYYDLVLRKIISHGPPR